MGEAASARLVANVPMGVTHDLITVCREDSTDIGPTERAALTKALREAPAERFVVTHGTDTMVETARYVAADPALATKAVVFTGAFKPERFTDSDAAFNVGCAVGALSVVAPGVYVAMNGRVMEAGLCKRNAAGKFVT
jgi:L-asparaginase